MTTLESIKHLPDTHPIWGVLSNTTLREDILDVILDAALKYIVSNTTEGALQKSAVVSFSHDLRSLLPITKEDLEQTNVAIPEPVE